MNVWEELVSRCAIARRKKLGGLSDQAFDELVLAVRENPAAFADDAPERAYLELARALDTYRASMRDDDLLDDDAYHAARTKRLGALQAACERAAATDPHCLDARLVGLLAQDLEPDPLLQGLLDLEHEFQKDDLGVSDPSQDSWVDVLVRPRLRLRAAVARTCLDGARYRLAANAACSLMDAVRTDPLGARYTCALAYARLEDEPAFDALDDRFGRKGNPWSHLARVLLLYKLDRMPAARRALRGFDELCPGGAYALLRPTFVELYLPDRPAVTPGGFEECLFAVRESEPIIADVPDFIDWCQSHAWLVDSAKRYADEHDLDW